MLKAAKEAESYPYLMQVALSNAADLCIHKADLQKAYDLYKQCVKIDASDMHSILGIGWIALMHDKNDSLAEKIFSFAQHYNQAPDALLKMEQLAEEREDSTMQKKYGLQFSSAVCDNIFGQMYNKYLIDLYTGVLNNPAKALQLAQEEIKTRHTPQTFAWYAWCLFCNNKTDEAYKIYKATVSGKPLEGLELYYMGKMMKGINKGYDAQQFFKAAYKNRYDLSSSKVADIEKILEE
jgi:tetratricopeptide (TPR) repeat protein